MVDVPVFVIMVRGWCGGVPGMGAVLHGFLTVFAPLEAIVHDVHIGARFDGVSGLSGSLGVLLLPWPVDVPVQKLYSRDFESPCGTILPAMDEFN